MQDQLKERLTGAAILVLVVVLAVPEMFRGRPPARVNEPANGNPALPLRTYTIDLRDTPAAQPATPADADAARPDDAAPLAPAPVPEAPAATAAAVPAEAGGAAPANAPTAPPPAAREPAPAAPSPAPAAAGASPGAGWAVQVGSFSRKELAERMTRQVHAKGFAVQMVGPDARGLYRVRSPLLPDRAAAQALRQQMVERGLKPIINATP